MKRFLIKINPPFKVLEECFMFEDDDGHCYIPRTQFYKITGLGVKHMDDYCSDEDFADKTGWGMFRKVLRVEAACKLLNLKFSKEEVQKCIVQLTKPIIIGVKKLPGDDKEKDESEHSEEVISPPKKRGVSPPNKDHYDDVVENVPLFDVKQLKKNLASQVAESVEEYCAIMRSYVQEKIHEQIEKRKVELEVELRDQVYREVKEKAEERERERMELKRQREHEAMLLRFEVNTSAAKRTAADVFTLI